MILGQYAGDGRTQWLRDGPAERQARDERYAPERQVTERWGMAMVLPHRSEHAQIEGPGHREGIERERREPEVRHRPAGDGDEPSRVASAAVVAHCRPDGERQRRQEPKCDGQQHGRPRRVEALTDRSADVPPGPVRRSEVASQRATHPVGVPLREALADLEIGQDLLPRVWVYVAVEEVGDQPLVRDQFPSAHDHNRRRQQCEHGGEEPVCDVAAHASSLRSRRDLVGAVVARGRRYSSELARFVKPRGDGHHRRSACTAPGWDVSSAGSAHGVASGFAQARDEAGDLSGRLPLAARLPRLGDRGGPSRPRPERARRGAPAEPFERGQRGRSVAPSRWRQRHARVAGNGLDHAVEVIGHRIQVPGCADRCRERHASARRPARSCAAHRPASHPVPTSHRRSHSMPPPVILHGDPRGAAALRT